MNQLVPFRSADASPALIAAAGESAQAALPRILHRQHPQPQHPPRLRAGGERVPGLVRASPRALDHGRAAGARRRLHRGADPRAIGADRQAAALRDPPSVRLACRRPGHAGEPGLIGARAEPRREARQDAGAVARGSTARARRDRREHPCGPARPRADRASWCFRSRASARRSP